MQIRLCVHVHAPYTLSPLRPRGQTDLLSRIQRLCAGIRLSQPSSAMQATSSMPAELASLRPAAAAGMEPSRQFRATGFDTRARERGLTLPDSPEDATAPLPVVWNGRSLERSKPGQNAVQASIFTYCPGEAMVGQAETAGHASTRLVGGRHRFINAPDNSKEGCAWRPGHRYTNRVRKSFCLIRCICEPGDALSKPHIGAVGRQRVLWHGYTIGMRDGLSCKTLAQCYCGEHCTVHNARVPGCARVSVQCA